MLQKRLSSHLTVLIAVVVSSLALLAVALAPTAGAQQPDRNTRIAGGQPAFAGQIPHQVSVQNADGHVCGGSVLTTTVILSASSCFTSTDPTGIFVRAGVINRDDLGGQDRPVSSIILNDDDLALLQLAQPLTLGGTVQAVSLATAEEITVGLTAIVSGWGAISENGPGSQSLLFAQATILDAVTCQAAITSADASQLLSGDELCTTSLPGDSCAGDNGGPLTISTAGGLRLAGITSARGSCGGPYPGLYANASVYAEWINLNAGLAAGTPTPTATAASPTATSVATPEATPPASTPTATVAATTPVATPDLTPTAGATPSATAVPAEGTCGGAVVTVDLSLGQLPTDGPDVIMGTPGNDIIAAGDGHDIICGGDGADTIWGQGGADDIYGGEGDDKLRGGAGNDEVFGGPGADDISGGSGDDRVSGGEGDDKVLRGGVGNDIVDGGPGHDALVAGNGGLDDVLGGTENDKLTGGPRPDELLGGEGDDELRGHKGADRMWGEDGNDTLFGGAQADMLDGGAGTDLCNGGTTGEDAPEGDTAENCEGELVNIP